MLRIAICDADENTCYRTRGCMTAALENESCIYKIDIFFSGDALFDALHDRLYDLILCDDVVGGTDMIAFARRLRAERYPAGILFVSETAARAAEAAEVFPTAYLKKPFSEACAADLIRFLSSFRSFGKKFYVACKNGEKYLIDESDILYIEVFHNDISIHLTSRSVVCRSTLTGFLERLDGGFVRCHQGYAVNLSRAVGIRRYLLTLDNGETVPVSKKNYLFVRDRLTGGLSNKAL